MSLSTDLRPLKRAGAIVAALSLAGTGMLVAPTGAVAAPEGPTEHTDMGVTGDDAFTHLTELSRISNEAAGEGFRSVGSPGYEAAGQYVEKVLNDTGIFDVKRQTFDVETQDFEGVSLTVDGTEVPDAGPLSYTEGYPDANGSGEVPLVLPGGTGEKAEEGCAAENYSDAVDGSLVVVKRGSCPFSDKVNNASTAGAKGVVVYNTADEPLNGTLGGRKEGNAPAVGVTLSQGEDLVEQIGAATEQEPLLGTLKLETEFKTTETFNIIADTKAGDPNEVIAMGSHLDGVPEGPGVNDNGSGVSGVLALAEAIAEQPTPNDKKIRLGFWGAEEIGLLGADEYVKSLSEDELGKIKAYLNYDMIGSDNYTLATYDSDASYVPIPEGVEVPEGSVELEKLYTDYYGEKDQPVVGSEFDGRSDYEPFMLAGVPVGGLFSGADGVKTEKEAELFGGTAGQPLDTNYHTAGDTLGNISKESLDLFLPGMGWAAHSLAWDLVDDEPEPTQEPTQEPTDDPTEGPAPEPSESQAPAPGGGGDDDRNAGTLPRTGTDPMPLVAAALALVLFGLVLAGVTRRKRLE